MYPVSPGSSSTTRVMAPQARPARLVGVSRGSSSVSAAVVVAIAARPADNTLANIILTSIASDWIGRKLKTGVAGPASIGYPTSNRSQSDL